MAVTQDPRFGIDVWGAGTDPFPGRVGWDTLLGLLTSKAAITSQGVSAALGAPGIPGRFFWATDTRRLYRDDGAAWTEISPVGGGGPGAGPTAFTKAVQPGAEGNSRIAARADHTHPLPAVTAQSWSWPRTHMDLSHDFDRLGTGLGQFFDICGGRAAAAPAGQYLAGFNVNLRTMNNSSFLLPITGHLRFTVNGVNLTGDARQDLEWSYRMISWQQPLLLGAGNIDVELQMDAPQQAVDLLSSGSGAYLIYLGPPG